MTQLTGTGSELIWVAITSDAELHLTSQTAGKRGQLDPGLQPITGMIQNQRAGPTGAMASFD